MKKYTLLAALLLAIQFVHGQAGKLDKTFGTNGKVSTDFSNSTVDEGNAVILQSDNKILMVGSVYTNGHHSFGLARYLPDGKPDPSFGVNGQVSTTLENKIFVEAKSIAIQPNGKILAGGVSDGSINHKNFTLIRYNSNGSIDSSFGTNGIVFSETGIFCDGFRAIHVLPDGKILAAGSADTGNYEISFILYRYEANGNSDETFGYKGRSATHFNGSILYSMIVLNDNRIVLSGNTGYYTMLVRYSPLGIKDSTFGKNGTVLETLGLSGGLRSNSMVMQPDGKFVLGGYTSIDLKFVPTITRFLSDGKIDKTFGKNGLVLGDFTKASKCNAIGLQKDGKIIIGGEDYYGSAIKNENFVIARLTNNGKFDSSFGNNGLTVTDIGNDGNFVRGLAIRDDGKIILAGYSYDHGVGINPGNFTMTRYNGNAKVPNIKPASNIDIYMYPNPSSNILHIAGLPANTNSKLSITDLNGNVRMIVTAKAASYAWNISRLQKGSYVVRVEADNMVTNKTFIKE